MNADVPPPASPSTPTEPASGAIDDNLGTLRALLRLIDPRSPFQPILLSSIDLVAWLAFFGRAAEQLDKSLRKVRHSKRRTQALKACEPFLRLTRTLCQDAEQHAFPPTGTPIDEIPEMAAFSPDSAICEEDASTIDHAIQRASQTFEASAKHRGLLCKTLGLTVGTLKKQLSGPGGLLRQMKRRCRSSRPFRSKYAAIADGLRAALADLPDPEVTPWKMCRTRFAAVRYRLEADFLPALEALVKELCTPPSAGVKKPEALKTSTLQAITAFLEAHGLASSLDSGLLAVQYHTLFRDLLVPIDAELRACGYLSGLPSGGARVIDDLRWLSHELIKEKLLSSWNSSLQETDTYATEVILAALDRLERSPEDSDRSSARSQPCFGVSDGDLSRWVRSGDYGGADALAERSTGRLAETKRINRTLQHLRRVGAAFHDRRQWTPADSRSATSTRHRLWTVNPLLGLLPRISRRLADGTQQRALATASNQTGSRPRPTRRNRGTRPRSAE